jgi:GT2 family glycosyltransferase
MKVSILTATYNSSETLEDCLKSICSQTYPHIKSIFYPFVLKAVLGNARKSYEETWADKNFDKYYAWFIELLKEKML